MYCISVMLVIMVYPYSNEKSETLTYHSGRIVLFYFLQERTQLHWIVVPRPSAPLEKHRYMLRIRKEHVPLSERTRY